MTSSQNPPNMDSLAFIFARLFALRKMAGLLREDLIPLSAKDLALKLAQVGLPKSLTEALKAKGFKGSTLLLLDGDDIKHELNELSVDDRIYLRNFLREIRRQEELPDGSEPLILSSDNSGNRTRTTSSTVSSNSGSTLSVYSEDSYSQTPRQTQQNNCSGMEQYKPVDLPSDFALMSTFGKKVDKAMKADFRQPGSLPHDLTKKVVKQVADHIEAENPFPSKQTIEWIAWKYCGKYPGLQQINPMEMLPGDKYLSNSKPFKAWGLLTEKLRRAMENKRYQEKRKSLENDLEFKPKKQKTASEEGTPISVNDQASLERHSKRLQEELKKSSHDEAVIQELMTAEFINRRQFIKQLDVRTRIRETLTKYPIMNIGHQLEEELLRILKFERKVKDKGSGVEGMLECWKSQWLKLKGYLSERFSTAIDDLTDEDVLNNIAIVFPTKHKKKVLKEFALSSNVQERSVDVSTTRKEPYILSHDEDDEQAYTIMIGDEKYCSIPKSEDSPLGHCLIQLMATYYVYHLEYPQDYRHAYFYLQQFVLADSDLCCTPRQLNCYHESIQKFLVFANSA